MGFFLTDKEIEGLLEVASRDMPMPDGTVRSFSGFKLMWKALDFLIVIGRWTRAEVIEVALMIQTTGRAPEAGLLPRAHDQPGPVSKLQIDMLSNPRIDPAVISLHSFTAPVDGIRSSIDGCHQCLHQAIAHLYRDLQERLGEA